MTATRLALVCATGTAALLGWRWHGMARRWSWLQWLGGVLLLVAIVTFWLLVVTSVSRIFDSDWNGARLAPAFALRYGYRLYYPASEGPILDHLYGPVAALAFLPASIFRTPTLAILAGGALQVTFVLGAMLIFVWRAGVRTLPDQPLTLACGLAACLLMTRYHASSYWITMVHADGPSLALGLLACAALVSRDGAPPGARALTASATALVLSSWAKQTAGPLVLALPLAVWVGYGRAVAWRYVLRLASVGAVVSVALLAWFGTPMLFNMVQVVSNQPWYKPGLSGLAITIWQLLLSVSGLLALLGIGLVVASVRRKPDAPLAARPWVPTLLAAIVLLPTGALGANKLGGEDSSFHSVYYLFATLAALSADTGRRIPAASVLAWALCALGTVVAWQSGRCAAWAPRPPVWQNNNQIAYEFALRHPGEAYFPWQPLATLFAEGRLYHFEFGMVDRYFGGYEPTPDHLRAPLSPQLRWIAGRKPLWILKYFPEFDQEVQLPELPGWVVHARASP